MRDALVALDLGTTSCRAFLFDTDGRVLSQSSRTYGLHTPAPGFAEQDPVELIAAADAVVSEVTAAAANTRVRGISVCTYMHSLAAVDEDGRCLTPLMTWADNRSARQVEAVRARPDWPELYARTGCPPHSMYPLYRFLWFREHHPELLDRARRFVNIKELLLHHWTGEWLVDYNLASGTGLLNMHTLTWDPWALELAGVRADQLSRPVPTVHTVPLGANRLGLRPGTPVVVGAGDGVLSSLGSGAIEPGVVAAMVGTSGALRVATAHPVVDPRARLFCYYLDTDRWVLGGSLNNGGIALRWLRDQCYPGATYEDVLAEAATVPAGAGALLFLPYLAGERSPGFNVRARGVWFGLGLEHTRAHMARSVLEAVAFRLHSVLGPIAEVAGPVREIRATGGYARSPFWLQICADVFGREVAVPVQAEGSSLGAFVLGAKALGITPDLSWVHELVSVGARLAPDMAKHERYAELFAIYRRVNQNLQGEFRELARFREGSA
jgi:gluconokinase